jgi:hypothetical protein
MLWTDFHQHLDTERGQRGVVKCPRSPRILNGYANVIQHE